jgi:hypothetical protein
MGARRDYREILRRSQIRLMDGCTANPDETPLPAASIYIATTSQFATTVSRGHGMTYTSCLMGEPVRSSMELAIFTGRPMGLI